MSAHEPPALGKHQDQVAALDLLGAGEGQTFDLARSVVLVSSRDRVLPGEDADAASVLEDVLTRRGMEVLSKSRMESVTRHGDEVVVKLTDGRTVTGSHCLLALGSIPKTTDLGLEEAGVAVDEGRGGHAGSDRDAALPR